MFSNNKETIFASFCKEQIFLSRWEKLEKKMKYILKGNHKRLTSEVGKGTSCVWIPLQLQKTKDRHEHYPHTMKLENEVTKDTIRSTNLQTN